MRRSFVSLTWTPGVDSEDVHLLIQTLEQIYELLRGHLGVPGQYDPLPDVRVFGAWSIPAMPAGSAYSDIGWCIDRSMDDAQKAILTSRYLEMIRLEPWQATHPHFDLCLTELQIRDDLRHGIRYSEHGVLGFAYGGLVSLLSIHPFQSIDDSEQRQMALQQTFAHYVGRLFDIPNPRRGLALGMNAGEPVCTNLCAMRPLMHDADDALSLAREQAAREMVLCEVCQRDLLSRIAGYHYGLN